MAIPQLLLGHFITVRENANPLIMSVTRKIPFDRDSTTFYADLQFDLLFIQAHTHYYLALIQEIYTPAVPITIQLQLSKRCPHIRELLDSRTVSYPRLRRVKYYHLPCRQRSTLTCFRDDEAPFMCICDRDRHANCFDYNFNQTNECRSSNGCESGSDCYRGGLCPMSVVCVCPECYYGTKCQFSTKGYGLSLDAILGYQIWRQLSITRQSAPVKVSIALTTLILFFGLLSGSLSTMTFQSRNPCKVGCGLYLLASSIITILTILVFTYKFLFLLLSQMSLITHRTSLHINCLLIDFVLRSLGAIVDWLAAAVAVERALTITKGINFDKKKSRHVARWGIFGIIWVTLGSLIHDPLHRELADDLQEERTWCVVLYSPLLGAYNSAINIFHFLFPFSINCISAIVIIVKAARNRSIAQKKKPYKEYLREQFHHHKHLLISPIVLVILAVPRLVIAFTAGCMKSARDPWLFLIGYFISFIPLLLTFIIFVLPSKMYKKEFDDVIQRKCMTVRRWLRQE